MVKALINEPLALGPLYSWHPVSFLRGKRPDRSVDYPSPSSAEVKLKTYKFDIGVTVHHIYK